MSEYVALAIWRLNLEVETQELNIAGTNLSCNDFKTVGLKDKVGKWPTS